MSDTNKRLKFFVWCAVVFCIMSSGLYVWEKKTEPEAENTAFIVAQKQMLSSANTYRQHWMLNQQPQSMDIDGVLVDFSKNGWPVTLSNNVIDCQKWLSLLWPDNVIFGQGYHAVRGESLAFQCEYQFEHGHSVTLKLVNDAMTIDVAKTDK